MIEKYRLEAMKKDSKVFFYLYPSNSSNWYQFPADSEEKYVDVISESCLDLDNYEPLKSPFFADYDLIDWIKNDDGWKAIAYAERFSLLKISLVNTDISPEEVEIIDYELYKQWDRLLFPLEEKSFLGCVKFTIQDNEVRCSVRDNMIPWKKGDFERNYLISFLKAYEELHSDTRNIVKNYFIEIRKGEKYITLEGLYTTQHEATEQAKKVLSESLEAGDSVCVRMKPKFEWQEGKIVFLRRKGLN